MIQYFYMETKVLKRTRAQESRAAIQRLYIAMRHLFIRGSYKPLGVSGEAMIEALSVLQPEIYGSINDPERVDLEGLHYIFQRLPQGIEECRQIKLISEEGYRNSDFDLIIPAKRRRNSYRIDAEQMYIEMTRGRSDIYDILSHLTFMYIAAEKIKRNSRDSKGKYKYEWLKLAELFNDSNAEILVSEAANTYLSTLLGRTYDETIKACETFANSSKVNGLHHIVYWLGHLALEEEKSDLDREISFSSSLREKVGHHYYGEEWAQNIKQYLWDRKLFDRPLHVISANLHSVMNSFYATKALEGAVANKSIESIAGVLSQPENGELRSLVNQYALENGMHEISDTSGMNINVQLIDVSEIEVEILPSEIGFDADYIKKEKPIIIVFDYAFGEQAYEVMDELLKPFELLGDRIKLNVHSISVMGKAGTLEGKKGDIMIPNAHVFEGSADNYPFKNVLSKNDFIDCGVSVFDNRPMITVLGTSLQNKDVLRYFNRSSWQAIGLEMEGAHYQKAIQGASKIRRSILEDIRLSYAYYASDNPLVSGQTLASGGLGLEGVKPTYLITCALLSKILCPAK